MSESMRLDDTTRLYTGVADNAEARRRVLVRHLARELDWPEERITLGRDRFGKPFLTASPFAYWFNGSACDGLMLIAGSRHGPVGADVETLPRCTAAWQDAAREFTPAEQARLAAIPAHDRPLAFARLWTAKEAVLKARGTGIVDGLTEPDLSEMDDPATSPPWQPMNVKVGGDRYAVTWYTLPISEVMVIAARARSSPILGMS
jgi:4'-phosphopantetheinyl transferase